MELTECGYGRCQDQVARRKTVRLLGPPPEAVRGKQVCPCQRQSEADVGRRDRGKPPARESRQQATCARMRKGGKVMPGDPQHHLHGQEPATDDGRPHHELSELRRVVMLLEAGRKRCCEKEQRGKQPSRHPQVEDLVSGDPEGAGMQITPRTS